MSRGVLVVVLVLPSVCWALDVGAVLRDAMHSEDSGVSFDARKLTRAFPDAGKFLHKSRSVLSNKIVVRITNPN